MKWLYWILGLLIPLTVGFIAWGLGDDFSAAVQLAATTGMLVVTFWYARSTLAMATTAERAAAESGRATAAAERLASAAADAAGIAHSQIEPSFIAEVSLVRADGAPVDTEQVGIRVTSTGANVVVKSVRIRNARRNSTASAHGAPDAVDIPLESWGKRQLPQRLHHGEAVLMTHQLLDEVQRTFDPFVEMAIVVDYGFSMDGDVTGSRHVDVAPDTLFPMTF